VSDQREDANERPAPGGAGKERPEVSPASEERFRLIIESVEDYAVFATDTAGRILSWNPGVRHLLGYEEAEWVGRHGSLIFTPEDRERGEVEREMETAARAGKALDERWHLRRDGSRFWASGLLMALRDPRGELRGYSKMLHDATRRKLTEDALRESSARIHDILESITDAFFAVDRGWKFVYANRQAERLLRRERGELLGRNVWEEFPEAVGTEFYEQYRRGEREGRPVEFEAFYEPLGVWFAVRAYPYAEGFAVYFRDVTARKRAEEERARFLEREHAARREAEEANRLKDEFLATLSHELRTPLTAILGWARLLRRGGLSGEAAERALEAVERNAVTQKQLIDDILDVSRVITGNIRLNFESLNLVPVIEAAIDAVRPAADTKGIEIRVEVAPRPGRVSGDADRLQQVVWNLLSNAIKFTPEGGRIEVSLRPLDAAVRIQVSDTGQGIEPEFLPHVFERFRQADATTTRRQAGLGLGLAIVRHLVELHGGNVSAESEGLGRGATFSVTLPSAGAHVTTGDLPAMKEEHGKDCPPPLEGLRVLVVDDDRDTREYLTAVLENCGARVRSAVAAREAFRLLEESRPEVIVSDIGMPGEDGYQLIRRVRKLSKERGGQTPAVALTAYAREEDRVKAFRAGFQMHLAKPVEPDDLVTVVASLAGRNVEE
jgi:PAS domain S-box-containing protein